MLLSDYGLYGEENISRMSISGLHNIKIVMRQKSCIWKFNMNIRKIIDLGSTFMA